MRVQAIFLAGLMVLVAATRPWAAEPLVADLSDHRIQITTGFTGTEVLLFGAVEEEGDVVVVVRGPEETLAVWRKDRYGGIWMNDKRIEFEGVPSFYAVGSNRPPKEIADEPVLNRHQIGVERLRFEAKGLSPDDALYILFRRALIRNMQLAGLFPIDIDKVTFIGARLFRAELFFPANVPTGGYQVEVFLLRDGQVVSAQTTPLFVNKAGIGAWVFAFAHQRPALHGIIAVLAALLAGSLAAYVFRRA
ncbi:MAG: TIGR02186 family protein [Kiloniellales bacterium]